MWLTKRFPDTDTAYIEAERGGDSLGSWRTKPPRLLSVGYLCNSCNSGWMSNLENDAKPIIENLLDDKIEFLDTSSQAILTIWAMKTAMVIEAVNPIQNWFYSYEERKLLRTISSIPKHTSVFISKCVDYQNIYSVGNDLNGLYGQDKVSAHVTTLGFDSIAFQVVTLRPPETVSDGTTITYDVREGPWDSVLLPIWPISPISLSWPPNLGLAGEFGLDTLSNRMSTINQ